MNESEKRRFKKIFKDYTEIVQKDPGCLFARIYGIYSVELEDLDPVHLILMGNTLKLSSPDSNL